jgi:hypothetical protein
VELADVRALRGEPAVSLKTSYPESFVTGRRYLIAAMRSPDGELYVGLCAGLMWSAARADGQRAWLASVNRPPDGGRIFGAVTIGTWTSRDNSDRDPLPFARVTLKGPVSAETTTDADGQYAFTGLPDGTYAVAVESTDPHLLISKPSTTRLTGDHAASVVDMTANVSGIISGELNHPDGWPAAREVLYLHAWPPSGNDDPAPYALATTDDGGRYTFTGLSPGSYIVTVGAPFRPAHARSKVGADVLTLGWAERVEAAPLVAVRAERIRVELSVVHPDGQPVETTVTARVLGPHGPLPLGRLNFEIDSSPVGWITLVRGVSYRFTVPGPGGFAITHDQVADGRPVTLVVSRP